VVPVNVAPNDSAVSERVLGEKPVLNIINTGNHLYVSRNVNVEAFARVLVKYIL